MKHLIYLFFCVLSLGAQGLPVLTSTNRLVWLDPNPFGTIKNYHLFIGGNEFVTTNTFYTGGTLLKTLTNGGYTVFVQAEATNGLFADMSLPFSFLASGTNVGAAKLLPVNSISIK